MNIICLLICYFNKLKNNSKMKLELQKEDIELYYISNYSLSLHAGCLNYIKSILNKMTASYDVMCVTSFTNSFVNGNCD